MRRINAYTSHSIRLREPRSCPYVPGGSPFITDIQLSSCSLPSSCHRFPSKTSTTIPSKRKRRTYQFLTAQGNSSECSRLMLKCLFRQTCRPELTDTLAVRLFCYNAVTVVENAMCNKKLTGAHDWRLGNVGGASDRGWPLHASRRPPQDRTQVCIPLKGCYQREKWDPKAESRGTLNSAMHLYHFFPTLLYSTSTLSLFMPTPLYLINLRTPLSNPPSPQRQALQLQRRRFNIPPKSNNANNNTNNIHNIISIASNLTDASSLNTSILFRTQCTREGLCDEGSAE